jgi:hypothetical protein
MQLGSFTFIFCFLYCIYQREAAKSSAPPTSVPEGVGDEPGVV